MSKVFQGDLETSDDDYVDPSIEKYFKKKEKKLSKKKENSAVKSNGVDEKKKFDKKKEKSGKELEEEEEDDDDAAEVSGAESDFEVEDEFNQQDENDEDEEEEEDDDDDDDEGEYEEGDDQDEQNDDVDMVDANEDQERKKILNSKMVKKWAEELAKEKPYKAINEVVQGFRSALVSIIPSKKLSNTPYKVEGTEIFNSMVRLCIRDLFPCILKQLNLSNVETSDKIKLASAGSNWKKLKAPVKSYLDGMLIFAENINEADILNVILRHIRLMVNFYLCFPKMLKSLIKVLIKIWSENDEKSRVIAFVCLHKITNNTHELNQDFIYKNLFLSFTRNSKFTSINTLPLINFMQRSLIEIYSINTKLAYEHVFIYIRQQAIHLRNAITQKKKESYQAVYNWQYVHCLVLWSKLLSALVKTSHGFNEYLQPLIYPLVQCITGTIKLIPTPRYYPLRFHLVNALISLSNATNVFIPVIPYILEVFDITDFNKKHATISVKQINFSFILKLNKQQLQDKSFKDVLIDIIYDNLILLLQHQSFDIAFPELVLPLIIRLKDFTKKCKSPNYCKVIKGLLDKITESRKCIEDRRSKCTFSLRDQKEVERWVEKNKELGTPLSQWYSRYKTMREREILMEISNKDIISKNNVPVKEKPERPTSEQKEAEKMEFGELFVNLEDDDTDTELLDFVPKKKNNQEPTNQEEDEEEDDDFADALQGNKKDFDDEDEDE